MLKNKDLLGLKDLPAEEIEEILDTAVEMKKILRQNVKKTPHLQGKSVVTLFYENSTRTRMSFELAAKFMSASTSSISAATSSVKKGESLIDTGRTLDALLTDIIVLRHSASGSAKLLAENVRASVLNGGDGANEHPTQALLDMFTMREKFGSLKGLRVCIAGDVKFSRVARSNLYGLTKMGASVRFCSPRTLFPVGLERAGNAVFTDDIEAAAKDANVLMGLRIQLERQDAGLFPSVAEYSRFYGLNSRVLGLADKDCLVMHPGPMNRGVEITTELAESAASVVEEQVTNGVAVRMAVLFLLSRGVR